MLAGRAIRGASWRSLACGALCCVALSSFSSAVAAESDPSLAGTATVSRDFPKRLAITVVADERVLSTFQQRVSSWFSDGTEVQVTVTSEVEPQQLLASSPTEVRAWIVPLSSERALLTFSSATPPAPARHLVREVRLRAGFDELGLERLASLIHSAFVALREGVEGVEREQAERELSEVGVASGALAPKLELPAPAPLAPTKAPTPVALRPKQHAPLGRAANPSANPPVSLLIAAGYGVRLRGAEGIGQGPSVALGVQLRSARTAFDLQVSGQYLFRSEFEAKPFDASVQTTALRVQIGVEPRLRPSFFLQALLGLGADIAQISASAASSSVGGALLVPSADGTQWRGAGDLSLGVLRRGDVLDLGVCVQASFSFAHVRYNAATSAGEALLVKPWLVQPALSIQGRFRSAL